MASENPVAIFTAADNTRAQMIRHHLMENGVEAFVMEDHSLVGLWALGTLPAIHTPQVWVDEADAPRAVEILQEFQRRQEELNATEADGEADDVEAVCEECGETALFPASQRGSVQDCPHCGRFMDVEDQELRQGITIEPPDLQRGIVRPRSDGLS